MIAIFNQDRREIIKVSRLEVIYDTICYRIKRDRYEDIFLLGKYKDEQRCKDILADIFDSIKNKDSVYEMPKE